MQVKFSPWGQTGDLGVKSNIMTFHLQTFKSISNNFIPNFVFSQIKDIKHIDHNFHSVT